MPSSVVTWVYTKERSPVDDISGGDEKTVKEKRPPRAVGKATDPKMRLVMGRGSRNAPLCAGVRTDLAIEYPERAST